MSIVQAIAVTPVSTTSAIVCAAFEDPGAAHTMADVVETGVTAIACTIDIPDYDAAVGITAPSWRIEEFGVPRAERMVEAISREIASTMRSARGTPNSSMRQLGAVMPTAAS